LDSKPRSSSGQQPEDKQTNGGEETRSRAQWFQNRKLLCLKCWGWRCGHGIPRQTPNSRLFDIKHYVWGLLQVVLGPGTPFRPKLTSKQAKNLHSTNSCLSSRNRRFSDRVPKSQISKFEFLSDLWGSNMGGRTGCTSQKLFELRNRFWNNGTGQKHIETADFLCSDKSFWLQIEIHLRGEISETTCQNHVKIYFCSE